MPWLPALFSAPALSRLRWATTDRRARVPFFAGLLTGDTDALVGSFAGVPELHHPVRGRVKGVAPFERFVHDTHLWLTASNASMDDVGLLVTETRTVEEVVLHLDADAGRVNLPVAIVADREPNGRLVELRVYFSTWPLTGGHAIRPPLLQPDPDVDEADVIGDYHRALAGGDAAAVLATLEADAIIREPAGDAYLHRGQRELSALYQLFFSNGGGITLEQCTATDDGRAGALEYSVTGWGRTSLPPQAGIAVYVRGASGKIASGRIYDDSDPPLG